MRMRSTGAVNFYNLAKGFGTVQVEENGMMTSERLTFIASDIQGDSAAFKEGLRVEFDRSTGPNGQPIAKNVRAV